jgi:hypothetical protein
MDYTNNEHVVKFTKVDQTMSIHKDSKFNLIGNKIGETTYNFWITTELAIPASSIVWSKSVSCLGGNPIVCSW